MTTPHDAENTEPGPWKVTIQTQVTYSQRAVLTATARALNISRAELVRRLLEIGLTSRRFRRMKPDEPAEVADVGRR